MVHALNEIRRVLRSDATLIDLRPLAGGWPVEVSWSNGYQEAGQVTDTADGLAADVAANAAMAQAQASGFREQRKDSFPLFYYWDTPKEMEEYIAANWENDLQLDDAVRANVRSVWATANAEARVRLRLKMLIARYQIQK